MDKITRLTQITLAPWIIYETSLSIKKITNKIAKWDNFLEIKVPWIDVERVPKLVIDISKAISFFEYNKETKEKEKEKEKD